MSAAVTDSTASIAVTVVGAATGSIVASGGATAKAATKRRLRSKHNAVRSISGASAVLPAAQDLPVLRNQRAKDRLQGREAVAALRLRARQDRAEPHHGRLDPEAARAGAGDQAGALSRALAI